MSVAKKPVNYLNNREILKQIHLSKSSYCSFTKKEYNQFDFIVDMPDSPLEKSLDYISKPENIQKAKEARASRLSYELGEKIDPSTIETTDLVIRVMTWDHIPVSQKQKKVVVKKSAKDIISFDDEDELFSDLEDETTIPDVDDAVHEKVNFPPFQHFIIDKNNSIICVGKSHWKGDLDSGEFCKTHGKVTDKLARMYIMMCEKYAMKYNWRGYSYNDEMRGAAILQLTYVGLRFNEAKSSNPFAYYTATITNSFCRVLNAEKKVQNIRDDILEINSMNPSWTRQDENSDKDYHG